MTRTSKQTTRYTESENIIDPKLFKNTNHKFTDYFNSFDYIFISFLTITTLIYLLLYFEEISWQLSSIGRIFLVKLLPYFDWRHLKSQECLIQPIFKQTEFVSDRLNCDVCEEMVGVDVYEALDEDILEERYIKLDNPLIISKGLDTWPNNSAFIKNIQEEKSSKLYPCKLSTNIFKGISDLETVLSKLKYFDQFFIHFQNCDLDAMRTLRKYTFRPKALPAAYSPTLYSWLIWNKTYNITNYKPVELVEKVTVIGQLFGSTYIRLIPRKNCETLCPILDILLQKRELLIFTSLWDLEYKPHPVGENMAVIMEYRD
uniref:Uncharacterized protein LOC114338430 n=1 Tax=Diabrotica virgifera virgifera TaxID=50390 RepID=A0A6P7G6Z9_DIAVI